ncbi:hypothetical protein BST61_g1543 [Cercospora zeina]
MRAQLMAFWMVKPRLKLEVRKTPRIAKELYEDMYAAFANGNLGTIEAKLSPGFKTRLEERIAQRASNTHLQWKLHKSEYFEDGNHAGCGEDQVAAEFDACEKTEDEGSIDWEDFNAEVEEKKNMKTMVEYFVIERTLINGQLGSWRAWGTTHEADLAEIRKAERKQKKSLMGGEATM